jgi:hypothetical protein
MAWAPGFGGGISFAPGRKNRPRSALGLFAQESV